MDFFVFFQIMFMLTWVKRKQSYCAGTVSTRNPNLIYTFELLILISIEVLGSWSTHVCSIIIVCRKEMEWSWGNKTKAKSEIWPWHFICWCLKSVEVILGSRSAHVLKYHHFMSKGDGVIEWKRYKLKSTILTSLPRNIQGYYSCQGQYMCELLSLYVKRKWSNYAETTFPLTDWRKDRQIEISTPLHVQLSWQGIW